MRGTRHTEEQILAILKQAEKGIATPELCRQTTSWCTGCIERRG
jgi:hypothetical protein